MTPRTMTNSPSVTNTSIDQLTETQVPSDEDSADEQRPTHTSEIGTLKKLPNHNTAWLGSSSGVYFVNTVRRAFSAAFTVANNDSEVPASEDILTGDDADGQGYNGPVREEPHPEIKVYRHITSALGQPPSDRKIAMHLVTTFFQLWHPLFPFLHGPQFLKDVDDIYASMKEDRKAGSKSKDTGVSSASPVQRRFAEHRKLVTFQLIINIASLDRPDIDLPKESRVKSTWDVTQIAGCIAITHDIDTIQACLAAELYLVATISLRQASTVAGLILKLIYHAGLHRCPLRYAQLSLEDCEIRKRIFWSAYALDRYLSLSLGDPNTVQDSDIDVCLSGKELHKAVARELVLHPSDEMKMHLPTPTAPVDRSSPEDPRVSSMNNGPQAREKQLREAAMTAYVHYGRLTGRVIEIFHKSIHARFPKQDAILYLNSDVEDWWNGLPSSLTGEDDGGDLNALRPTTGSGSATHQHRQLAPFFMLLYQQLLLVLNRPRLSLDQSTAEFQHGLQVCIKASRTSITALKKHKENGQSMLLPGMLSATWMAGLIIAFACQLGKYPKARACSDITACLRLLESIGSKNWFTVKHCHKVLSLLLENIHARRASTAGYLVASSHPSHPTGHNHMENLGSGLGPGTAPFDLGHSRKRSHPQDDDHTPGPSPKKESSLGRLSQSPSNPDFRVPLHPASSSLSKSTELSNANYSTSATSFDGMTTSSLDQTANPGRSRSSTLDAQMMSPSNLNTSAFDTVFPFNDPSNSSTAPAAASNARTSAMSEDPMFWGNLDMNMSDIFSAASWENMTGFGGPMGMNMSGGFDDGLNRDATLSGLGVSGDSGFADGVGGGIGFGPGIGAGGNMGGYSFWGESGLGNSMGTTNKENGNNDKVNRQSMS